MQFMLILNETPEDFARRANPAEAGAYWGGWNAFIGAMAQAGVIVKGDGLQGPPLATTLRIRDGKRRVEDGPFADTKEQLGGYFVIEVPDLDAALDWAAKAPSALTASVEVRPILPPCPRRPRERRHPRRAPGSPRRRPGPATASSSRSSRTARATSRRPRTRCPTRSSRRWPPGPAAACPRTPKPGSSPPPGTAGRTRPAQAMSAAPPSRNSNSAPFPRTSREDLPDQRLRLLFVCAHPAIDPAARTPLMLQTVLGIDAARIAQRLPHRTRRHVPTPRARQGAHPRRGPPLRSPRARTTSRTASPPCSTRSTPPSGAAGTAWDRPDAPDALTGEAIWLARLLVSLMPDGARAQGPPRPHALLPPPGARRGATRGRLRAARPAGRPPLGPHHDRGGRGTPDRRPRRPPASGASSARPRSSPSTSSARSRGGSTSTRSPRSTTSSSAIPTASAPASAAPW